MRGQQQTNPSRIRLKLQPEKVKPLTKVIIIRVNPEVANTLSTSRNHFMVLPPSLTVVWLEQIRSSNNEFLKVAGARNPRPFSNGQHVAAGSQA